MYWSNRKRVYLRVLSFFVRVFKNRKYMFIIYISQEFSQEFFGIFNSMFLIFFVFQQWRLSFSQLNNYWEQLYDVFLLNIKKTFRLSNHSFLRLTLAFRMIAPLIFMPGSITLYTLSPVPSKCSWIYLLYSWFSSPKYSTPYLAS